MKKIKQLPLVFTIFSLFMLSFFITSTFAISDEHAFRGSQMDQIPSNRQSRESHTGGIPQRNDRMEFVIEDEKRLGKNADRSRPIPIQPALKNQNSSKGIPQRNDRMEMYIEDEKRLGEKPKDGFVTPHL